MRGQAEMLAMTREQCGQVLSVLGKQTHQVVQKSFGIGRSGEPPLFGAEFDYALPFDLRDGETEILLTGGKAAAGRAHGRAPDADEGVFFSLHWVAILKYSAAIYDRNGHLAIPFCRMCLNGR
jgi:hypothetical protein